MSRLHFFRNLGKTGQQKRQKVGFVKLDLQKIKPNINHRLGLHQFRQNSYLRGKIEIFAVLQMHKNFQF